MQTRVSSFAKYRAVLVGGIVVFIAQLALLALSSKQRVPEAIGKNSVAPWLISPDQASENNGEPEFLLSDPMLFASPQTKGFSGPAWLNVPAKNYTEIIRNFRENPTFWLSPESLRLGAAFDRPTRAADEPLSFVDSIQPSLPQARIFSETSPKESSFRIEGKIYSRSADSFPDLKGWPSPQLLSNSVVQLGVAKDGSVVSARLLGKSGSEAADDWALAESRKLSFNPANAALEWGKAIFNWATLPPISTNVLPVTNTVSPLTP